MSEFLKFSICIPTYNRGPDLLYTIRSVIEQSYPYWELKVIDDSRNNETEILVKSLNDTRIIYHKNASRLGLVRNWNECLKRAGSDYFMILHHDDYLVKDALLNYKKFIDLQPLARFIHANSFTANLPYSGKVEYSLKRKKVITDEGDEGVLDIMLRYGITCSTVLFHKECVEKVGYYDEECWVSPDWEYSARIAQYFKTYFLSEPTVVYVYHNDNTHTNAYDVFDFARQSRHHFEKVKSYLKAIPEGLDETLEGNLLNAIKGLGVMMFTAGKYSRSFKFFIYAKKRVTYKTLGFALLKRITFIYKRIFFKRVSYKELFENNFDISIK
jgi:glycosyltransferase involved in cell wall biosynthesis